MRGISSQDEEAKVSMKGGTLKGVYGRERLMTYNEEDSLKVVIEKVISSPEHKLVLIEASTQRIRGIITLTDIVRFIF